MSKKILFVEDSFDLGNLVKQYLESKDFLVDWYTEPNKALQAYKKSSRDFYLCLLDVQMPVKSGFQLAQDIMQIDATIPFVFLTARTEKKDRLQGLGIGAADYITKPFDIDELVLRIRNIIKRAVTYPQEEVKQSATLIGDVVYNRERLTITLPDNRVTSLTLRESQLLEYFVTNCNRRIKKEEILVALWGQNDYFLGRSLDVFISRLRKILSGSFKISIQNVYSAGYIFTIAE